LAAGLKASSLVSLRRTFGSTGCDGSQKQNTAAGEWAMPGGAGNTYRHIPASNGEDAKAALPVNRELFIVGIW
jgi:hypothetical protein